MTVFAQLLRRYDHAFNKRPVLTMMLTNLVLGGVADTTAQTVTHVRQRLLHTSRPLTAPQKLALNIDEKILEKLPHAGSELIPTSPASTSFDFARLARFASWGFIVAPVQFKWLQFLHRSFPLSKAQGVRPLLKRVALDQLLFAPVGLLGFFTYVSFAEGGGMEALKKRLDNVYIPAMKANYLIWPAVQWVNFRFLPLKFQMPFAATVGVAWGVYLSLANSSSTVKD
ncbi:hypothetical protein BZA05DRAFT_374540 [Tricharina praecox]|uniref:uncharacterized protein n=1 Tax=Tricharina praecox TaxID=43433 RepID=UPI002220308D|nr:uncharacterized protein BZA05DRAFT_374540 [Tricharina praecox]KAI5849958.1 hypothetical protein BZA05DRAFT_374540 [Tricharina praecox]